MLVQLRDINYQQKTLVILGHIQEIVEGAQFPISVRGIHYQLVSRGIIDNTENQYKKVSTITTNGRYTGHLPWDKIVDDTRAAYKTPSWDRMSDSLIQQIQKYRRNRWENSSNYIEVWVEKRTMTNLFYSITNGYDINLVVGGGFNSASAIWNAVTRFAGEREKKSLILYFGDYDPSGWFMSIDIENRIREFGIDVTVDRILLNKSDVERYNLPQKFDIPKKYKDGTIKNKLEKDANAKRFLRDNGELTQVEMDALEQDTLLERVRKAVEPYIDQEEHEKIKDIERNEQDRATRLVESLNG